MWKTIRTISRKSGLRIDVDFRVRYAHRFPASVLARDDKMRIRCIGNRDVKVLQMEQFVDMDVFDEIIHNISVCLYSKNRIMFRFIVEALSHFLDSLDSLLLVIQL